MPEQSNNKRIAKNTIYLYIRMFFSMLVALYTSRVILQKLGVDDFGIYNAVGGIVGFLSFLNSALATGSSRFLTFELGRGDNERLKRTFSSLLTAHIFLSLIIVVLAETIGLWFLYNKMVIPPDRMHAAVFTFHISIITAIITIIQVPYNASIISHEKMDIYAYVSIFEVVAKLAICYLLGIGGADKLILYATFICIVHLAIILFYRYYCIRNYSETKYKFSLDKELLKPVLSFSGWSLFADSAVALTNQGILVLLNMFFAPAVVTARAISLQVNNAANQFVNNFRTAANPQIVKLYAVNDFEGSKKLLLESTKFSYYLMLVLGLPIVLLAEPILHLWLGENVPEYTTIFLQLVIIQSLFQVFDRSFYTALYAKGQLKENALISPTIVFIVFPIIYLLFKAGYSPVVLSWAYLISYAILGLIVKPILIVKHVDYKWSDIFSVYIPCILVTIVAVVPSVFIDHYFNDKSLLGKGIELCSIILVVLIASYTVGLDKTMRNKINTFIKTKIGTILKSNK